MKQAALLIAGLLIMTLYGCGESTNIVLECASPLIPHGDGCCLDADQNGKCDIDEKPAAKNESTPVAAENKTSTSTNNTAPANTTTSPEKEETTESLLNTKEEAEKTARMFVERWQLKQYNLMYALFTDNLKQKKTPSEFSAIMTLDPFYKKLTKVNLTGVSMQGNDRAEMKIVVENNVQTVDIPAAYLEFRDGQWKADAFEDIFGINTFDAACSGYKQSNQYTTADCAFDLARYTKNPSYCDSSECHYVECLKAIELPAGMHEEARQCFNCQPYGKTVVECILDVAIQHDNIEVCNVIAEGRYSDKYCECYGGFAKHKKNNGFCNIVQDSNYRELCLKGYEGQYC
ncbi:hypothetical protein KY363_05685 [Candidatus Woesearchaeota archaeon]|nr:hypothetical protein [Candidatus Woesearchaeota archaeon]